jgi:hypothetical protein
MQFSWALRAGGYRPLDFARTNSFSVGVEAGPGISFGFNENSSWVYGLILGQGEVIQSFPKGSRYGPMVELGAVLDLSGIVTASSRLRLVSELNHPFDRFGYWDSITEVGLKLKPRVQLRSGVRVSGDSRVFGDRSISEWSSELRCYFE